MCPAPAAAPQRRTMRASRSGAALRLTLFLLAVARSAQPATAIRALHSAEGRVGAADADACCLEVELLTPWLAPDAPPPSPGTRFEAARARAARCSPVAACGDDLFTLLPTAELSKDGDAADPADPQRPFSLTMRLRVPSGGPQPAWPDEAEARGPPGDALLPARTWTHFAGDSLLRGVFSTMAQYVGQKRWEQWQGEAYYQSVFHMSRILCCDDVARAPDGCTFALHNESSPTLFAAARAALAEGRTCATYSFLMDYAAIREQMRQMTQDDDVTVVPSRLVTSAGVHTMKHHDAAFYKDEVNAFLAELETPPWSSTFVAMHNAAAPNYTMVAAAGHKQTPEAISAFNAALCEAVAASAASRGIAAAPRLVDLHAVTAEHAANAELAAHVRRRFPRLDALHFRDALYQTAFVADALALQAAQRMRDDSAAV